jgi:hypothetical protein
MTDARHLAQFNIARIRYPLDDPAWPNSSITSNA